jgi:hypothetical protein
MLTLKITLYFTPAMNKSDQSKKQKQVIQLKYSQSFLLVSEGSSLIK